jgi:hypothetical protein
MWFSCSKEGSGDWAFCFIGQRRRVWSLLSGNSIVKMVKGLFVLYVVFRAGFILRLAFISVPWQLLLCFWVDISAFPIDEQRVF